MIVSFRDKRTGDFAAGKRVNAFLEFARLAHLKLDRFESATSPRDLAALPGNRFEALHGDPCAPNPATLVPVRSALRLDAISALR